jgi:hypothetical protein
MTSDSRSLDDLIPSPTLEKSIFAVPLTL